jgi:hypothetical protein
MLSVKLTVAMKGGLKDKRLNSLYKVPVIRMLEV